MCFYKIIRIYILNLFIIYFIIIGIFATTTTTNPSGSIENLLDDGKSDPKNERSDDTNTGGSNQGSVSSCLLKCKDDHMVKVGTFLRSLIRKNGIVFVRNLNRPKGKFQRGFLFQPPPEFEV